MLILNMIMALLISTGMGFELPTIPPIEIPIISVEQTDSGSEKESSRQNSEAVRAPTTVWCPETVVSDNEPTAFISHEEGDYTSVHFTTEDGQPMETLVLTEALSDTTISSETLKVEVMHVTITDTFEVDGEYLYQLKDPNHEFGWVVEYEDFSDRAPQYGVEYTLYALENEHDDIYDDVLLHICRQNDNYVYPHVMVERFEDNNYTVVEVSFLKDYDYIYMADIHASELNRPLELYEEFEACASTVKLYHVFQDANGDNLYQFRDDAGHFWTLSDDHFETCIPEFDKTYTLYYYDNETLEPVDADFCDDIFLAIIGDEYS